MDGHPRDAVAPGQNYSVSFPVRQRAGTYFYHPHTEPLTGNLVYRGLAGGFIVEDPADRSLGLPSGDHDVLLLVQDKRLRADRQLVYEPSMMDTMTGYLGDTILVNGTPDAYLSVDRSIYRLRLVNGSNARVYKLGFSDGRSFHVVATDGGLIEAPVRAQSAFLAPGERLEILVDFSTNQLGDEVKLRSLGFEAGMMAGMGSGGHGHNVMTESTPMAWTMMISDGVMGGGMSRGMGSMAGGGMMPGDGIEGMGMETNRMGGMTLVSTQGLAMDILRFYVDRQAASNSTVIPTALSQIARHDPSQAQRTRAFTLGMNEMTHTINGDTFSVSRVDFEAPFGELEIWEFRNETGEIHPMHPHGALFQVLDRNGDTNLPPENLGWKDTVPVWPNETVRVLIRFDAYAGLFVSHCHNLEHEDSGMMQNLEVAPNLSLARQGNRMGLSFPAKVPDHVLETTSSLGPGAIWTQITEPSVVEGDQAVITVPQPTGNRFFRLIGIGKRGPGGGPGGGDSHAGHHP